MSTRLLLPLLVACGGSTGPTDARLDASFDASFDAALDASFDASRDVGPDDAAFDAVFDAPVDAPDAPDALVDAGICPEVRVGGYVLDGTVPASCPPGEGEGLPEPVISLDAPCRLRVNPDPVVEDRLRLEGTLDVDAEGRVFGTLSVNGIETECAGALEGGAPEDRVLALDCGDCDVRFRPRR
ncbi:MAG: hypothetical protein H6720_00075 [Sandaracinus sp.]|nr:hypothetical protein [Sandaracinus sp.]MCB9624947.1 hypothetical protein [Sandaracinus sp.]